MATIVKPKPKPSAKRQRKLIPKPRLTRAEIERKRTKPAGYCVPAWQQQTRILKNKRIQSENRFGRDGFKRKGIIMDMFSSFEGLAAMAALMIAGKVLGGIGQAIGAGIAGLIFGKGGGAGSAGRISRQNAEIVPSGNVPNPDAGNGRSRKPKLAMGGSGGEDTGTAPVSSRRRDTSPAAAPVPVQAPLTKRQQSHAAGDRIRDRAGTELGDRNAYDFIVAAVAFKPGHQGGDPREMPGAADRLAKLSKPVAAFIMGTHAGSTDYAELRAKMGVAAAKIAGSTHDADKAHLGSEFLPILADHAQAWVAEQEAAFQAGGPKPEADHENEGGERGARPRPGGNDEPETLDLPTPFGRK